MIDAKTALAPWYRQSSRSGRAARTAVKALAQNIAQGPSLAIRAVRRLFLQ